MKVTIQHSRLFSLCLILCTISFSTFGQLPKVKKVYPTELAKDIKFGMKLRDFKTKYKKLKSVDQDYDFREVYMQNVDFPKVSSFIYYFDTDGDQLLYEIMIVYRNSDQPLTQAKELFGNPNYEEKEWRVKYRKRTVWSWAYKNKLILVTDIPDTEWSDKF